MTSCGLDCLGTDFLDVRTPADYQNAVKQLKVSADNLNLTAASLPGWKGIYDNALALYEKYKDAGWWNFASMSDATWYAIADSQKRIDEFAAQMRTQGLAVAEPVHVPIPQGGTAGDAFAWIKDHWLALTVAGVAVVTVPVILPPIIGAAMMARGRR